MPANRQSREMKTTPIKLQGLLYMYVINSFKITRYFEII